MDKQALLNTITELANELVNEKLAKHQLLEQVKQLQAKLEEVQDGKVNS